MRRVQGTHGWSVTFEDIVQADVLLLVGTNAPKPIRLPDSK